jgi:hypothetical protein
VHPAAVLAAGKFVIALARLGDQGFSIPQRDYGIDQRVYATDVIKIRFDHFAARYFP